MIYSYISLKSSDISVSVKNLYFGYCTVIYMLERIYQKDIYKKGLKVRSKIFNLCQYRGIIQFGQYFCLKFCPPDRMSGVIFVWSDNLRCWSDIARCPTVILRPGCMRVGKVKFPLLCFDSSVFLVNHARFSSKSLLY